MNSYIELYLVLYYNLSEVRVYKLRPCHKKKPVVNTEIQTL